MHNARPLPRSYVSRYHGWRATAYEENRAWYRRLVEGGQHPRAMVVACCDSRVHVTSIFGADQGEFFIHRNIANLVPPHETGGNQHGTSAALEYAVVALRVAHVIVLGHSGCGGVAGCKAMCSGEAPELEHEASFVGRWMDLLRPGWERVEKAGGGLRELEHEAILVSLDNLMTFPFVRSGVEAGTLDLHGCWHDIGEGELMQYVPDRDAFVAV